MSEAARKPQSAEPDPDPYARREALRRRLAEQGITIHVPAPGGVWQPPEHPLPFTGDELSAAVIRMRKGEPVDEPVSNPALEAEPDLEHAPDLLAFQRRAAEIGLHVRLPSPNPDWDLPGPIDLDGATLGDMVVRLRRAGP